MLQKFKTTRDRNGNTYYLYIDHNTKEYCINGYFADDCVLVSKKDLNKMEKQVITSGYKEVDQIR